MVRDAIHLNEEAIRLGALAQAKALAKAKKEAENNPPPPTWKGKVANPENGDDNSKQSENKSDAQQQRVDH